MAETPLGSMSPASIGHQRCTNETQSFVLIITILSDQTPVWIAVGRIGEGVAIRRDRKTFTVGERHQVRRPTKV